MKLVFRFIFILLLFSCLVFAENRVQITSNELTYDVNKKISIFKGDVDAIYDNSTIKSDLMYVYLDDLNKPSKIVCKGSVKIVKDNMTALADNAVFDIKEDILVLEGDVKIWQNKNYLEGDKVTYYNKEKRVEVKNNDKGKVKIIFIPENNQN